MNLFVSLFDILAQVKYTNYRDRPFEERKRKFVDDLQEGHSVIVSKHLFSTMRTTITKISINDSICFPLLCKACCVQ